MALSRTIQKLLARAAETSTIDDNALDDLGRRLLEALILDPDTPLHLKDALARRLSAGANEPSPPASDTPEEAAR